jgi:hypothetical protein
MGFLVFSDIELGHLAFVVVILFLLNIAAASKDQV